MVFGEYIVVHLFLISVLYTPLTIWKSLTVLTWAAFLLVMIEVYTIQENHDLMKKHGITV
jgi:hypothetical protein